MDTRKTLQRMTRDRETQLQPSLAEAIESAPSGQPLQDNARAFLEPRMSHSFENVRIHADSQADNLAQQVNANAFTTGNDIFFRQGAYQPDSSAGMQLLAHELTHTVQQTQGPVAGTPSEGGVNISDPNDSFEQAAVQNAEAMMQTAPSSTPSSVAPVQRQIAVQREPEEEEMSAEGTTSLSTSEAMKRGLAKI